MATKTKRGWRDEFVTYGFKKVIEKGLAKVKKNTTRCIVHRRYTSNPQKSIIVRVATKIEHLKILNNVC